MKDKKGLGQRIRDNGNVIRDMEYEIWDVGQRIGQGIGYKG